MNSTLNSITPVYQSFTTPPQSLPPPYKHHTHIQTKNFITSSYNTSSTIKNLKKSSTPHSLHNPHHIPSTNVTTPHPQTPSHHPNTPHHQHQVAPVLDGLPTHYFTHGYNLVDSNIGSSKVLLCVPPCQSKVLVHCCLL